MGRVGRLRRLARLGSGCLALALAPALAAGAGAAELVDLRVGRHPEFTRVVLETDAPAEHRIESAASDEIRVSLEAESEARVLRRDVPLLEAVRVEPAGPGRSRVRLVLEAPARLKAMVLSDPDRVVLDLRPAPAEGAAAPESEPAPPPAPEPEPTEPSGPETPAPGEIAEAPEPAPEPEPESTGPSEPETPAPGEIAKAPQPPPETAAAPEPGEPGAEGPEAAGEEAGREVAAPSVSPPRPDAVRREAEAPPPSPERGGPLSMLPAPLDRPVLLAGLALLLLLVVLLAAARRRARAAREEEAPLSPFSAAPEEAAGLGEEPEVEAMPSATGAAEPEPALGAGPEPGAPAGAPAAAEADLAPQPGGAAPAEGGAPALEERLARMEARVDELTDAKERLERQVAAQTEELRVQRAAIARTQRVLRTVTRPEDEPSEPARKS